LRWLVTSIHRHGPPSPKLLRQLDGLRRGLGGNRGQFWKLLCDIRLGRPRLDLSWGSSWRRGRTGGWSWLVQQGTRRNRNTELVGKLSEDGLHAGDIVGDLVEVLRLELHRSRVGFAVSSAPSLS
jgi:hypothetical protein